MSSYNVQTDPSDVTFLPEQFAALRDRLAQYSGIYVDETRQRSLLNALTQRMTTRNLAFETYIDQIHHVSGQGELQKLTELILNHETVFFRNQPHMRVLRETILPHLHEHKPTGEPLRIWSAGCATGEEPYSLAIVALESLGDPLLRPIEIRATDLSETALAKAHTGIYSRRALNNLPAELSAYYFEQRGDGWLIKDPIRTLVHFEQHNLLRPFPSWAREMDIILCQNVTIYFQLSTCRALIERFYQTLKQQGILLLGFSETLWNVHDGFDLREINGAFVYYKKPYYQQPGQTTRSSHASSLSKATGQSLIARRARRTQHKQLSQEGGAEPEGLIAKRNNKNIASSQIAPEQRLTLDIIQHGRELLDTGRAVEAIDMLSNIPLNGPLAPQAVALVARAHANSGNLDQAVAEAHRAIELDSLTTEAYMLLGVICTQQGQLIHAVQYFERARYLDSNSALISFYLAEGYRQLNRHHKAMREYRNALHKLSIHTSDAVLDGVAVAWVRETCHRYIEALTNKQF